jgi:hypothetical protein
MQSITCPPLQHFHVVFEQVGSLLRPSRIVIAPTPEMALSDLISRLPKGWRGGVSVFDDDLGHEDEMPILHSYIDNS